MESSREITAKCNMYNAAGAAFDSCFKYSAFDLSIDDVVCVCVCVCFLFCVCVRVCMCVRVFVFAW